jgi:hypothetical protein
MPGTPSSGTVAIGSSSGADVGDTASVDDTASVGDVAESGTVDVAGPSVVVASTGALSVVVTDGSVADVIGSVIVSPALQPAAANARRPAIAIVVGLAVRRE